jgi:cytochrome P450
MSLYTSFDHLDPPIGIDGTPYTGFEALRDEAVATDTPIGWSERHGGFWVVTGWAQSREIHHNVEAFSNTESAFPRYGSPTGNRLIMAEMDPPEHKRYRRLVNAPFSPMNAAKLDGQVRAITNELIDRIIDAGRVDFSNAVGNDLPGSVIASMLGLPPEDGEKYRTWTEAMAHGIHKDPEGAQVHLKAMGDYWDEVIEEKQGNPQDDVLSLVVHSELDGERLTENELKDFCTILLIAGIDNTSLLMNNMCWRLAWDIDLRRRLIANPSLIPTAVEEFLRLHGTVMVFRLILKDVTVEGVSMKKGQVLGLVHQICNRDPREFPYPDAFLPDRTPNRHLGLGLGIHRCLGAHLVKVEARIFLEEFLRRVPDFRLDRERRPRWMPGQVGSFVEVPIEFPPGGGYWDDPLAAQQPALAH